jgi:hypothetical protein
MNTLAEYRHGTAWHATTTHGWVLVGVLGMLSSDGTVALDGEGALPQLGNR